MRVRDLDLPLVLFETFRTQARQKHLFEKGYSKVKTNGPHYYRCAWDLVIAPDVTGSYTYPDGRRIGAWLDQWRSGLSKDRKRIIDAARFKIWREYGRLIRREFPQLEWGGRWGGKGKLMGWDPYHVQLKNWAKLDAWQPTKAPA